MKYAIPIFLVLLFPFMASASGIVCNYTERDSNGAYPEEQLVVRDNVNYTKNLKFFLNILDSDDGTIYIRISGHEEFDITSRAQGKGQVFGELRYSIRSLKISKNLKISCAQITDN